MSENGISKKEVREMLLEAEKQNKEIRPLLEDRRKRQDLAQEETRKCKKRLTLLEKRYNYLAVFVKSENEYNKEQAEFAKEFNIKPKNNSNKDAETKSDESKEQTENAEKQENIPSRNIDAELDEVKMQIENEKKKIQMYKNYASKMKLEATKTNQELAITENKFRSNIEFSTWFDNFKKQQYVKKSVEIGEKAQNNKSKIDSLTKVEEKIKQDKDFKQKYETFLTSSRDKNKALKMLVQNDPECAKIYDNIKNIKARKKNGELSLADRKALDAEIAKFNYIIQIDEKIDEQDVSENEAKSETTGVKTFARKNESKIERQFNKFINSVKRFFNKMRTKKLLPAQKKNDEKENANEDETLKKIGEEVNEELKNNNAEKINSYRAAYRDALMLSNDAEKSFNEYNKKHGISNQVEKGLKLIQNAGFEEIITSEGNIDVENIITPIKSVQEAEYKNNEKYANIYGKAAINIDDKYKGKEDEFRKGLRNGFNNAEKYDYVKGMFERDSKEELEKARYQIKNQDTDANER